MTIEKGEAPNPEIKLLKIDGIAGMHYKSQFSTETLVIYGIGAPIPPDNGNLPDAPLILERKVDVFVPDYIGYGRSDGDFTPENCIKTFTDLFENFSSGCLAKNSYDSVSVRLKYSRIIFIGRSFGGTYIPVLPVFNPDIKELAVFYPVVDSKNCGSVPGEETNEQFLRSMKEDGYHHLYRGVLDDKWVKHLGNEDDLSPMDNIRGLASARLFIAHGMKDPIVHYSHSENYYRKIFEAFPHRRNQFAIKLYPEGDHSKLTSNPAVKDFLDWLDIKK